MNTTMATYVLASLVGSLVAGCSNAPASLGQYHANSEGTGGNSSAAADTGGVPGGNALPALGGGTGVTGDTTGPTVREGLTCPILNPTSPVFYPGDASSPCPVQPPNDTNATSYCSASLSGVRCTYPALYPDGQDTCTCTEEGGIPGPDGATIPGTAIFAWVCLSDVCKRTGNDCTLGLVLPSDPRTQLTTACESRNQISCMNARDITAQSALDNLLGSLVIDCLSAANLILTPAAVSVWFDNGCPKEFVVHPSSIADCVQKRLESERYDCSSGLVCGATGQLGGCDLC
jgi:hypothetical protein